MLYRGNGKVGPDGVCARYVAYGTKQAGESLFQGNDVLGHCRWIEVSQSVLGLRGFSTVLGFVEGGQGLLSLRAGISCLLLEQDGLFGIVFLM